VYAERETVRTANALECQRLTPSDSCTAFDVDMFSLYGWLRSELAEMPCEQWSIEILPPNGEMCLIDHGQASVRAAPHREKKNRGEMRTLFKQNRHVRQTEAVPK